MNSWYRDFQGVTIYAGGSTIKPQDLTTLTLDDLNAKLVRFQSSPPKSRMLATAAGYSRLIFTPDRLCLNIVLPL